MGLWLIPPWDLGESNSGLAGFNRALYLLS